MPATHEKLQLHYVIEHPKVEIANGTTETKLQGLSTVLRYLQSSNGSIG